MEDEVMTFDFFGEPTRLVMIDGDPWFFATDVARTLGYRNAPDMTRMLDEDEISTQIVRSNERGNPNLSIISLPGLFKAVMSSRKDDAKKYARWVTHEVLPAVHKSGGYLTAEKRRELEDEIRERMGRELSARLGYGATVRTREEICRDVTVAILDKIASMNEKGISGITCDVSALAIALLGMDGGAGKQTKKSEENDFVLSQKRLDEVEAFCDKFCDISGRRLDAAKMSDLYDAYKRSAKERIMKRSQLKDAISELYYDKVQFAAQTPRGEHALCVRGMSLKKEWWKLL